MTLRPRRRWIDSAPPPLLPFPKIFLFFNAFVCCISFFFCNVAQSNPIPFFCFRCCYDLLDECNNNGKGSALTGMAMPWRTDDDLHVRHCTLTVSSGRSMQRRRRRPRPRSVWGWYYFHDFKRNFKILYQDSRTRKFRKWGLA